MDPCQTKEAYEVEMALRRLCGKRRPGVVQVASDRAPEILKALKDLGFASEPSPPYQKLHNALAESSIRTIKGMTAAVLLHSGLEHQYWPLAQKYLEWMYNITTQALGVDHDEECKPTRYEKAMGYLVDSYLIPFGALVWYKDPNPYAYGPKGEPALFLGAELVDGFLFKGNYRVWPLDAFEKGGFKEFVTRTLAIPNGGWTFPAIKAEASAFEEPIPEPLDDEYEPTTPAESVADPDQIREEKGEVEGKPVEAYPAPGAGSSPSGRPKLKRHRAITTLRIAVHGKTPGCDGCREGTYDHSQACRTRFDSLLNEWSRSRSAKVLLALLLLGRRRMF